MAVPRAALGEGAPPDPAGIAVRLERLPVGRAVWTLVFLISLGGFFEIYDLFLTAYLAPGLVRAGIFPANGRGALGLSPQATFAAATFAGLWLGTILLGAVADRFGRRPIFAFSLLWYSAATAVMAFQRTAFGLDLWRLIAGVGIGVELVTIDAYISELVPARVRTRAFAFNAVVQFTAVPAAAFLAWLLVPHDPWGVAGWRWVAWCGAAGALVVWTVRRSLPESPRWLAAHGRADEAARIVARLEQRTGAPAAVSDRALSAPAAVRPFSAESDGRGSASGSLEADARLRPCSMPNLPAPAETSRFREIWRPPYRRRTIMLVVFQFFQTIGFYGFGNWLPTLLAANGASFVHSLQYSFAIALAYPIGPVLCLVFVDRFEPKWQLVWAAGAVAVFGLIFGRQHAALPIVACGALVTFANCALSYAFHAYQTELYPTRVRARAVGFCYSWSRLSTVFSSYLIAFFLLRFGSAGVFAFIAASMAVVMIAIGAFGPRTRGMRLEEVSS